MTDTSDFDAWAAGCYGRLLHAAHLLTGDRNSAQDLVQTALVKTLLAWRRVHTSPDAFVRRVMITSNTDRWRLQTWREDGRERADLASLEDPVGQVHDRSDLLTALQDLPPRMRAIVVARYYLQLTERECADLLGCSVGTVKSTASRGLDRLRAHPSLSSKESC